VEEIDDPLLDVAPEIGLLPGGTTEEPTRREQAAGEV